MLECLVFGKRAAKSINVRHKTERTEVPALPFADARGRERNIDYYSKRKELQQIMHAKVGPVKTPNGMLEAKEYTSALLEELEAINDNTKEYLELLNIATVAMAIINASIKRKESIGSHYVIAD
jgi:L-aspartate oxidase